MKKSQVIRPEDAKEYIGFQFKGLEETLELFDYKEIATVIRATHSIFKNTQEDSMNKAKPDCILLETHT